MNDDSNKLPPQAAHEPQPAPPATKIRITEDHEATGEVAEMMEQIAQIHSEDVTYEVSKLAETIEPILLGIMGVMVGILLLGVFTPLWNLGQATLHPGGH